MGSRKRSKAKSEENHLSLRGRIGAYRLHALYDPRITTAAARSAFNNRFCREVDPNSVLPEGERLRRAEAAKKAYFSRLAYLSAKARAKRRNRRNIDQRPQRTTPGKDDNAGPHNPPPLARTES